MLSRHLIAFVALAGGGLAFAGRDLQSEFAAWNAVQGGHWRIDVDEGTGYAEFLFGGAAPAAFEPLDEADWFTLARGALAATQALHGIQAETLQEHSSLYLPLGMVGSSDKVTVRLQQVVERVPVDGGFVNVLFDAHGRLLSVQTRALPDVAGFDVRPRLAADTAAGLGRAAFERDARLSGALVAPPQLVIAQLERAEQRVPLLAWKVDVQWLDASGAAEGFLYWIDAHNGALVKRERSIHEFDVGGTVYTYATPGTPPDSATNPETQQPMRYARVTSASGTTYTDAAGNFNFVGATGPLTCTFTYVGTFNNVTNQAGAAYSSALALTGTGNTVVLNSPVDDLTTAQANCFQAIDTVRDWVRSVNPSDAHADFVHVANANIASTCNAYYNGTSINFYQAGGGCANTAYSTVVAHEDGHWLNSLYGTGNGSDGMGEGNADVWAMYVYDDPIVGLNFCGSGCNVRNGLNTTMFCGDASPACYGEVHADGEPWMGAAWKVRRNLDTLLGNAAGDAVANALFLGWMNAYNQTQIKSVIELQWLTLDDDDGNINNGTPHYDPIDDGFVAQGFPGVTLQPIAIANVTQLPTTTNQVGPYAVTATVNSNVGAGITGAALFYKYGNGAYSSVAMANTGGSTWAGAIPGSAAPEVVSYYVRATDSLANAAVFPAGAPAVALEFGIGIEVTVSCDNFETNLGWTVANTSLTTGAWVRGVPIASAAQPGNDNPGGTGTQCWFTGQGAAGGGVGDADVDGGPTVLTSPVFNLSNGNGTLSYAYWMYNDDGDDSLIVEVSANGAAWVEAKRHTGGAGGWANGTLSLNPFITPTATTYVRFKVSDNPNNSITEAAIDDVCVKTLGPIPCTTATYCTPKVNSQGCLPVLTSSGSASVTDPNPFTITASNLINQQNAVMFYGFGRNSAPFYGGYMCVLSPLVRTGLQSTGGSTGAPDCTGTVSYDMNARIRSGIDPQLVLGAVVDLQVFYRDPTGPQTVGLSGGVEFSICN